MFLPYYLHAHNVSLGDGGSNQTYRDLAISSIVGIFGPIVTTYLTFIPHLGYKPAFCLTAAAAAAFSGAFTSITNETQNLAFSCMLGFWNNALYAAFYAYVNSS